MQRTSKGTVVPKNIRFDCVGVLSADTKILGATAGEWDKAFTGNMKQKLQELKRLVECGTQRNPGAIPVLDVASTVSKHLRQS